MNLPNALTLIRFFFIPLYLFLYFSEIPGRIYWAFGVLLLAGLTDVIDGYLARRNKQVTQLGIMLDPLADKLMMLAVFLSLLISQRISLWAALAIFARDLGMIFGSALFHFRGKKTVPAKSVGQPPPSCFMWLCSSSSSTIPMPKISCGSSSLSPLSPSLFISSSSRC